MPHKRKSDNLEGIAKRKGDHIRLCLDERSQADASVFSKYRLPYSALPEIALEDVDASLKIFGKALQSPLMIASMTGGSEHGRKINTNLAKAAEKCGVAMGVGSQRIGIEKEDAKETFELVRKYAPNAFIAANMGAVQLNYGHTVESYQYIVDMIRADAIYLHLNPLQEALQPGGDTNFEDLLSKIATLTSKLSVPVFVKEVGHGISYDVAKKLYQVGVVGVDTAGVGGTSYAWVESERARNEKFAEWFKDCGIDTDESIMQSAKARNEANKEGLVIASGGIRGPVDGLKSLLMGADLFSAAVPFLEAAMDESPERIIETIENWKMGLRIAMFSMGVQNIDSIQQLKGTTFSK